MGESPKSFNQHLGDLALVADMTQNLYKGKTTIIFELDPFEFATFKSLLDPTSDNQKQFKIDISGTEFIYLLDESSLSGTTF
jgi:hypothetical protein